MAVAFTFDVLPRTPCYVLQLKCPIFTYFSMLVKFHIFCQKREYLSVLEACLCCYVTVDTKHIRYLLRAPILQV